MVDTDSATKILIQSVSTAMTLSNDVFNLLNDPDFIKKHKRALTLLSSLNMLEYAGLIDSDTNSRIACIYYYDGETCRLMFYADCKGKKKEVGSVYSNNGIITEITLAYEQGISLLDGDTLSTTLRLRHEEETFRIGNMVINKYRSGNMILMPDDFLNSEGHVYGSKIFNYHHNTMYKAVVDQMDDTHPLKSVILTKFFEDKL